MAKEGFKEKLIFGEITGKHQAIHAYDKLIWTIRAGFLTFWFGGWGIILKAIIDSSDKNFNHPLLAMVFVSIAFSVGGLSLDINYLRRKFRVIQALDKLLSVIIAKGEMVADDVDLIKSQLQVSGDKKNNYYLQVSGYMPALMASLVIYLTPMFTGVLCVLLLWETPIPPKIS